MEGMPFEGVTGERLRKALLVTVIFLAAFLAIEALSTLEGLRYIGTGVAAANTIMVTGHGEDLAVPDIATFTFSVVSDKATVADAQANATAMANAVTTYLTAQGVAAADIQTSSYSINPQYEYQNALCPQTSVAPIPTNMPAMAVGSDSSGGSVGVSAVVYCPQGKQVLTGYEVSQSTTVKVRDTSKAGTLLAGVGSKGATQVSGLTFTFDDPTGVQTIARNKAIADAKSKATALASQLGVSLVRVVSFNENQSGGYATPMVYAMAKADTAASAPDISPGQNTTTDDVSITYEIR